MTVTTGEAFWLCLESLLKLAPDLPLKIFLTRKKNVGTGTFEICAPCTRYRRVRRGSRHQEMSRQGVSRYVPTPIILPSRTTCKPRWEAERYIHIPFRTAGWSRVIRASRKLLFPVSNCNRDLTYMAINFRIKLAKIQIGDEKTRRTV